MAASSRAEPLANPPRCVVGEGKRPMSAVRVPLAGLSSLVLVGALGVTASAQSGATHVVAADGSAEFSTIGDALAAAADGDTVLVRPGAYRESLLIDKGVSLQGDGAVADIVVDVPQAVLVDPPDAVLPTLLLRDADASVSGLTILGSHRLGGIQVQGGTPILEGNAIGAVVALSGDTQATIRDNTFLDFADVLVSSGASALIEGNDFTGGSIRVDGGVDVTVRDNSIRALVPVVGEPGIDIRGPDTTALVTGNSVTDAGIGVNIADGAAATVQGNQLAGNGVGVAWFAWIPGAIDGNTIEGGALGIAIGGDAPSVTGNTVDGAAVRGLAIGGGATPSVDSNSVCGSETNLWVSDAATPTLGQNDICADATA
jgi:nitrous oxidase accessory protein NosD